jgi:hypothetical protein
VLRTVKRVAKPLLQSLTAAAYTNRPVESWPSFVGTLHEINVPRGVVPNPIPQPVGGANINNVVTLFNRTRDIPGEIAECGVFRGSTLVPLAIYLRQQGINKTIHGFDSFEGFA